MWTGLLCIAAATATFSALDRLLTRFRLESVYYAVHTIHNAAIVYLAVPDVIYTFLHFRQLHLFPPNYEAIYLCYGLHFYHCILYWRKFRFDDWLHHILMIAVALPIGTFLDSHTLTAFSLFFTTGLPGGIDYALLFGVRNGWVDRMTEKKVNRALNVWIRSPGCAAQAAFTLAYMFSTPEFHRNGFASSKTTLSLIPALLVYWNGQYFMGQVVADYARLTFSGDRPSL
jgi:hypothetical protein